MAQEPMIVSLKTKAPPEMSAEIPKVDLPKKKKSKTPMLVASLALALLAPVLVGMYVYFFDFSPDTPSTTSTQNDEVKPDDAIAQIRKHILLPENETPVVATVSDPEKLQDQPFFAKAKVGYVVLIYTESKKAYLYDPKRDILVDVASIVTDLQ